MKCMRNPAPSVLALFLQVAGDQLRATLHAAAAELYRLLSGSMGGQEGEVVRVTLEGAAWVWTGEGFAGVDQVALDSPVDFRQAGLWGLARC